MNNPMRPILVCSLLVAGVALATPQQAQNNPYPPQRETQTLRERLALSREQQAQFQAIRQDRKAQLSALEADTSLSPAAHRQKSKAIHAAAESRIRAILNENQLTEYDQILRERREAALRKRQTTVAPTTPPQPQTAPPPQ